MTSSNGFSNPEFRLIKSSFGGSGLEDEALDTEKSSQISDLSEFSEFSELSEFSECSALFPI